MRSLWQRLRLNTAESLQQRELRDRDLQHLQHPALPAALLPDQPPKEAIAVLAEEVLPVAATAHGEVPAVHLPAVVPAVPAIQHLQVDLPDRILQAMHRNL